MCDHPETEKKPVWGFVSNVKKWGNFIRPLMEVCENHGVRCVPLDLTKDAHELPSCDLVVHKITQAMSEYGIVESATKEVDTFEEYLRMHPSSIIVEGLDSIRRLLRREQTLTLLDSLKFPESVGGVPRFQTSTGFVHGCEVSFPVMVKTSIACGAGATHLMEVVSSEESLGHILSDAQENGSFIIQEYVDHGGLVFKVYVVGEKVFTYERQSSRDLRGNDFGAISFNSQHAFPEALQPSHDQLKGEGWGPSQKLMEELSVILRRALDLDLFGFDVIHSTLDDKFYIIDVNYLPTYRGIPNIYEYLYEYVAEKQETGK
jgi:inositol-1,3,4-trisphosphate 5/6-kinase / inositol-tetrakisphosphate 1-kinase